MKKNVSTPFQDRMYLWLLVSVSLFLIGMAAFMGHTTLLAMLSSVILILMLASRDASLCRRIPVILLSAFVAVCGLTFFWAVSGKFYLREFSKIVIALAIFFPIATIRNVSENTMRNIMLAFAGFSAIFGFLNVEAASTGLTVSILGSFPEMAGLGIGFEAGTRLTGILGNANIMASILALGIFFSLALLVSCRNTGERILYSAFLAINAFAFLLGFSMGGIACFVVAIVVYLVFSGKQRGAVFFHMLAGAIPSLVWGFASFPFFNRPGAAGMLPLIFLIFNVLTVMFLECKLADRLLALLEDRAKLGVILMAALILLGGVYGIAGINITGAYTFHGDSLRRGSYPEAGIHSLSVHATGDVSVEILSQNMTQVMMHTNTQLYQGPASQADFTVPENSEVCYFIFSGDDGVILEQALLDNTESLPLDYKLFPGFVENRLQGLKANQNAIQRTVFFSDGLKLAGQHPILGCGVGSFESSITSVQDFFYETRYVHNHYIQVFAESGLVGLILFVGSLLSLGWVLFKKRKTWSDSPYAWAYPALWAALVMVATHAAVEVSMSNFIFLIFAYATFGMITSGFYSTPAKYEVGAELEEPAVKLKGAEKKKQLALQKAKEQRQRVQDLTLRGISCVLPILFLISIGLNYVAKTLTSSVSDATVFMEQLKTAASIDPYEKNDYMLSYVINSLGFSTETDSIYIQQSNEYAAELLSHPSNSIPAYLVEYYLNTHQYLQAVDAAKASAHYSASDSRTWNRVIHLLRDGIQNTSEDLFNSADGPRLIASLKEYVQMLTDRNESSMEDIQLDDQSLDFIKWLSLQ